MATVRRPRKLDGTELLPQINFIGGVAAQAAGRLLSTIDKTKYCLSWGYVDAGIICRRPVACYRELRRVVEYSRLLFLATESAGVGAD